MTGGRYRSTGCQISLQVFLLDPRVALLNPLWFFSTAFFFFFKVQKHRSCSTFRFGSVSCHSSDRASTGLMHSSLAYLSKCSLFSASVTVQSVKTKTNILSLNSFFFFSSSTKCLDFWLSHLQSCSGKFPSLTSHHILCGCFHTWTVVICSESVSTLPL